MASAPPPDDQAEIVVTALRDNSGSGSGGGITYVQNPAQGNIAPPAGGPHGGPGGGTGSHGGSTIISANVGVHVNDPDNLPDAILAARHFAATLTGIESDAEKLDPETKITWGKDGGTITAGQLVQLIESTTFVITDNDYSTNNGVGGVFYHPDGTHTDQLDFRAFDGMGTNDYASPNYNDNQGMNAAVLHELGHMTEEGERYNDAAYFDYVTQNHGSAAGYAGSIFWTQNEKMANDFMSAAARGLHADISSFGPPQGFGSLSISDLHHLVHP